MPCRHSIAVTRKVPSAHLIVAGWPLLFSTHFKPSQIKFAPQPVGEGVGDAVAVGMVWLGAQEFPFQEVFIPQPPGGGLGAAGAAGAVGAGPPFFSQLDCVEPSLQRTA